jgi:hypothetical protein
MADISKITTLDGTTYDLKDPIARSVLPWAVVDSTSTSTVYTATVPNVTELKSGVTIILMNNKVTSAANCTLNINGLGAKPMYMTNAATTRVTTQFATGYTWMLIYNETRVSGGCWDLVYLYNTNTTYSTFANLTIGNAGYLANSVVYRYQLLFQMNDNEVTPLNNANNVTATTKTMLTDVEFDPFGRIFYYNTTGTVNANARVPGANMLYATSGIDLRYSFNCGATLTTFAPLYLQVSMQDNGKVKIASASPLTHELPSSADGYYYIYLGRTYATSNVALEKDHPIYYHDGTGIKELLPQNATATSTTAGLMSSEDKTKLDGFDDLYLELVDSYAGSKNALPMISSIGWNSSLAYANDLTTYATSPFFKKRSLCNRSKTTDDSDNDFNVIVYEFDSAYNILERTNIRNQKIYRPINALCEYMAISAGRLSATSVTITESNLYECFDVSFINERPFVVDDDLDLDHIPYMCGTLNSSGNFQPSEPGAVLQTIYVIDITNILPNDYNSYTLTVTANANKNNIVGIFNSRFLMYGKKYTNNFHVITAGQTQSFNIDRNTKCITINRTTTAGDVSAPSLVQISRAV